MVINVHYTSVVIPFVYKREYTDIMRVGEGYGMINYLAGCHKLRKLKQMGANDDCIERLNVCLIL